MKDSRAGDHRRAVRARTEIIRAESDSHVPAGTDAQKEKGKKRRKMQPFSEKIREAPDDGEFDMC